MMLDLILLQAQQGGSSWMNILMIVLIFVVFWLFLIRPQTKRQKEIQKFQNSLEKGTRVVTSGGLMGTVQSVKEDHVVVEIAKGIEVKVAKNMVFASQDAANPQGTSTKKEETEEEAKMTPAEKKEAAAKEEKKQKIQKIVLYAIVLVCAVVGIYFLTKNRQQEAVTSEPQTEVVAPAQESATETPVVEEQPVAEETAPEQEQK